MDANIRPNPTATLGNFTELLAPYASKALVLQGGGALGAYQGGVFEALCEVGIEPDWLSGVSIGGINAAIIAGNTRGNQLDRLRDFWDTVSSRNITQFVPDGEAFRLFQNQISAWSSMTVGLPGFYTPRTLSPWLQMSSADESTSLYDTSELKSTLNRLIDWEVLNNQEKRLSLGAVNVRTGNFRYFDTKFERIGPEHIMASGALPPAFPAIKIDNEFYWDGGIVSNTPLQYLLEIEGLRDSLVFTVDLFSAQGSLPRSMTDVLGRQKDITFSSRTRNNTDTFKKIHSLQIKLHEALQRLPQDQLTEKDRAFLDQMQDIAQVDIVHLIYQQKSYEGHEKDYEFSNASMKEHWAAGLGDTRRTLRHREWFAIPDEVTGVAVHDLHRDDPV